MRKLQAFLVRAVRPGTVGYVPLLQRHGAHVRADSSAAGA
jgi:hypothetical protein